MVRPGCEDVTKTTTPTRQPTESDIFEEMDRELGNWLRSDATVIGPLKCLPGWGGVELLRRGLGGDQCGRLPQRCSARPLSVTSTQALSIAAGGQLSGAGSCLSRLLQTITSLQQAGDLPVHLPRPGRLDAASSTAWRPRRDLHPVSTTGESRGAPSAPSGDEALAIQLQFGDPIAALLPDVSLPIPASEHAGYSAFQRGGVDQALALALSLAETGSEDPDDLSANAPNFRAEARQRVQARRSASRRQPGINSRVNERDAAEPGAAGEPDDADGFYSRLWGLDVQTYNQDDRRSRRRQWQAHPSTTLTTPTVGGAGGSGSRPPRPRPSPPRTSPEPPVLPDVANSASTAIISFSPAEGPAEACAICCEQFVEADHLRLLPCLHRYHVQCIDRWLGQSQTCPICKHTIT
ncbi:E3 ubiquitin-protein ligase RLIM [Symbiodinium microadriaticum]|uniref:RING-type E3 ubiquitin transferase n=1 Tax=Symbiodinium microadriaticum TaxID=2951 RepID=A0A1Q9DBG9_SYMMI|nr:E3 ubiquitin-protein ligase RLIM [Symbiodinium microadriaticum]